MSFKDQPISRRLMKLGDEAEGVFESVYPNGYVRFGLCRPPINLTNVPAFVRYTPDYLTAKGMVEVQGFGKDQTFKLKQDKMVSLLEWHSHFRVDLFVWDSTNRRYGWIRLPELVNNFDNTVGYFPEGKMYYAWHADVLPVIEWHEGKLPVQS